ncbi:MAG: hypothetical protein JWR80_3299 [Bradyrhizobium sp.]|nr:hypothetical protein [Bradyrhizobium sp.]
MPGTRCVSKRGGIKPPLFLSRKDDAKLVYLDSSDFSHLSAPEATLTDEQKAVLARLRQHKAAGTAIFYMSTIHFGEAVHASREHKQDAIRRGALMRELCEGKVLRYPTEIAKLELRKALRFESGLLTLDEITSSDGEWFGFASDLDSMLEIKRDMNQQVEALLNKQPRKERRKLKSELNLKKRSSHAAWRKILKDGTSPAVLDFPLNLLNQETVISWFLGEVSDTDFQDMLLKIMSDPHAMFATFLDETKHREKLYEILRKQGREQAETLMETTERLMPTLTQIANSEHKFDLTELIEQVVSKPGFLGKYIETYSDISSDHITEAQEKTVIQSCPSLFTFIEITKAYLVSSAYAHIMRIRAGNTSIKEINPSDFSDIMHAFYAPYFDVFRCDSRFGAQLKKHKPIRMHIADRIGDLMHMLPMAESERFAS